MKKEKKIANIYINIYIISELNLIIIINFC